MSCLYDFVGIKMFLNLFIVNCELCNNNIVLLVDMMFVGKV